MSNSGLNSPPSSLTNVPKSVLKALDPSEALRAALTAASNDPVMLGPEIALRQIQSYLDAAKRQQRRIERIKTSELKAVREGRRRCGEDWFAVVHFYLICWTRIGKLADFIRDTLNRNASKWGVPIFQRIGLVLRRYKSDLKNRIDARDHFEHFEERLPGEKNHSRLEAPSDLGNMWNEFLTIGGRELDVGPNSIRLLKDIVADFQRAVLYDSLEALEGTDETSLIRLLNRAARDVNTARVTK